jgi:hypothetical protein
MRRLCLASQLGAAADLVTAVVIQGTGERDDAVKETVRAILRQFHPAKEIIVARLRTRMQHCNHVYTYRTYRPGIALVVSSWT